MITIYEYLYYILYMYIYICFIFWLFYMLKYNDNEFINRLL